MSIPVNAAEHILSVVDHPGAHAMKPLVEAAYRQIGLTVIFEPLPIGRRLLALQNGTTDGDVVGRSNLQEMYSDVVRVGPSITQVDILLVCPENTVCSQHILTSGVETVIIDRGTAILLQEGMKIVLPARHEFIESPPLRTRLFNRGRIDYFIYFRGNGVGGYALKRAHQKTLVGSYAFYHYINKRHASLAEPLSIALADQLKRGTLPGQVSQ